MSTSDMLLVLGVVEGRHFPKRPHHHLLIEANFDGEALNTETLKHIDCPRFNTELAWEIDKKSLHQHRLQRTPIKVQVFALEMSSMRKELVGYCIVDLRTAQQDGVKKSTWHNLLSSKYRNTKPSIKLALAIEVDKMKAVGNVVGNKEMPVKDEKVKRTNKPPSPLSPPDVSNEEDEFEVLKTRDLSIVLDNEQGYYVIGEESKNCQIYVLSVTINGMKNLVNLIPSTKYIQAEEGFYFYYALFDNDVTNETFYDLTSSNIPTERASVRIKTTFEQINAYLQKKQDLKIYFCSNDITLGEALVPLCGLTSSDVTFPKSVDGMFPFRLPRKGSDGLDFSEAFIGVSVVIRKEEDNLEPPEVSPVRSVIKDAESPIKSAIKQQPYKQRSHTPPIHEHASPPVKLSQGKADQISLSKKSPTKESSPVKEMDHHFTFSIDLRSIGNLEITNPVHCYCRYVYPYFGSSAPVMTQPPTYVQRNCEAMLHQSFCRFEFASTPGTLQATFSRIPLIIEVWTKSENDKDALYGVAQIFLSTVFQSIEKPATWPLTRNEKIPIFSGDRPGHKIGYLHIVLSFEDKGEIRKSFTPQRNLSQNFQPSLRTNQGAEDTNHVVPRKGIGNEYDNQPTNEYQVAMALELWRQEQEEFFNKQLALKERERMNELAEEWKQRDLEREMLLKKKMKEYTALETSLKNTLLELDDRKRQLIEREQHLERTSEHVASEYEHKMQELREASRRLKEDYQHQLTLEKARYRDLDERFQRQVSETRALEEKLKEREKEMFTLKENLVKRPDVKMQTDMNLLLVQKNELERKIESITKSKIHYKQQWGRALRELARIKMNEQEEAKTRLKKQQQELDHMKLRYLAAEEKKVLQTEKEELTEVRDEIAQRMEDLKRNVLNSKKDINFNDQQQKHYVTDEHINFEPTDRVAKLIEERDLLLQTGVYTMDDPVIAGLDKEIRLQISKNGS